MLGGQDAAVEEGLHVLGTLRVRVTGFVVRTVFVLVRAPGVPTIGMMS